MMKVKLNFKDNKGNPTEAAKAFIEYLSGEEGMAKEELMVESPENILGKGADYFVSETGLLLETTFLLDREDLARSAKWGITVNTLSKLIKEHPEFSDIKGLYSISTQEDFGLKAAQLKNENLLKTKISQAVKDIIQAILTQKEERDVFGYKVKIEKVNEIDNGIYFSTIGKGRSINVAGIFHENLKNKFEKANTQLAINNIKGEKIKKRILLIVNKYRMLTFDWDLFEGLSYSYEDLVQHYKNIDEIWFQVEGKENNYSYQMLYRKSVFQQIENGNFSDLNKEDLEVFAKWFSSLEKLNDKKKLELIEVLKNFLQNKAPHALFPEPQTRIEMVRYGGWLAENNQRVNANWLVKQFINDPDPLDPPTDDEKDYGNQLHESIKSATKPDIHTIQTVKGHLAWTVQMLAMRKDFLKESYEYTQATLRNTKNLYLVLQWLFPLTEISNRRFWLKELDEDLYKDFKKLSFEMLQSYSQFPDIAKGLIHVFHYFRELTTDETKEMLDKLEQADDFEAILLYFAVFRERHFKEKQYSKELREYDPAYAKEKLTKIVLSEDKDLINLRSGIAWNIWKILSEDDAEFDTLSSIIDQFLTTNYDSHLFHNFERIVEDQIDKHFDKSLDWYIKILNATKNYLEIKPEEGHNVWLGTEIREVLRKIAKKKPEVLLAIIGILYEMWMKGAYVGTISEIFTSFKDIKSDKSRRVVKEQFQSFYGKMKEVNPKLQDVDWD